MRQGDFVVPRYEAITVPLEDCANANCAEWRRLGAAQGPHAAGAKYRDASAESVTDFAVPYRQALAKGSIDQHQGRGAIGFDCGKQVTLRRRRAEQGIRQYAASVLDRHAGPDIYRSGHDGLPPS